MANGTDVIKAITRGINIQANQLRREQNCLGVVSIFITIAKERDDVFNLKLNGLTVSFGRFEMIQGSSDLNECYLDCDSLSFIPYLVNIYF